jgi:hypothetical protein
VTRTTGQAYQNKNATRHGEPRLAFDDASRAQMLTKVLTSLWIAMSCELAGTDKSMPSSLSGNAVRTGE